MSETSPASQVHENTDIRELSGPKAMSAPTAAAIVAKTVKVDISHRRKGVERTGRGWAMCVTTTSYNTIVSESAPAGQEAEVTSWSQHGVSPASLDWPNGEGAIMIGNGSFSMRRWREEDAGWYLSVRDDVIFAWTTESADVDEAHFVAELDRLDFEDRAGFALTRGDALAGNLVAVKHDSIAELSYWVAPRARGAGAATAGLVMLRDWVLEHWDVDRIELLINPENAASIRVAEKAGFASAGRRKTCASCAGPDGTVVVYAQIVLSR